MNCACKDIEREIKEKVTEAEIKLINHFLAVFVSLGVGVCLWVALGIPFGITI